MIPLTLRGMQGALRRPVRSSARSFFALPSVLALLALALFPVLAHAESSSGTVYKVEGEVPSIESKGSTEKSAKEKSATHHTTSNNAPAEGSAVKNGGGESSKEPEGEAESEEGQKNSGGVTGAGGNGNPPTTGSGQGGGSPKGGTSQPGGGSISPAKALPKTQSGTNISESSGGSSPVVPILIAVAVLAAISIGVVLYRQRKSGQGPDRRVSSPNAS